MGTKNESEELQSQIKLLASELGWSRNELARILYTELNEWDDEDEITRFQGRLKKELQRSTTNPDRLRAYLSILVRHPRAIKADLIFNKCTRLDAISPSLREGLVGISQDLDKVIKAKK